jgi:2-polyprenyl-3-methyl-5-hydroxy-6-metoxy-1,4-benzoquinol methylase
MQPGLHKVNGRDSHENYAPEVRTREIQYQRTIEIARTKGLSTLGLMTNQVWNDDPRHLVFTLARYKFVAKMLSGRKHVLEVGCADAFGTRLVQQEVERVTATDFDETFVDDVRSRMDAEWPFEVRQHDLLTGPFPGSFDGAYAMDVIEHIPAAQEDRFVGNIVRSLTPDGILIVGSPSLESQVYASPPSKAGHVNCKSGKALKAMMERFFHNVFLFSMNDEVVHTGFVPMAHYLIAIGSMRREPVIAVPSVIAQGAGADQNPLDISIVVPCLNEQHHIGPTLDTIVAAMLELPYSYEVLVVDDGSTDDTTGVVETYLQAHPSLPIRLIRHATNRGLTRSYVDGAFLGRGTYYRLVCGDNAEPKEALVACFRQIGKADMIVPYHHRVSGKSAFRLGLSRIYTSMVNLLSGHQIRYYNGLATHLRYNVMRWGPYSFGFGFQAELITRLLDEGATYVEVPVAAQHRDKDRGSSALNLRNFLSVGHTLSEVFLRRIRKRAMQRPSRGRK